MKRLIPFLLLSASLWAQAPVQPPPNFQAYYVFNVSQSLTSAAGVYTLQQPATVTKTAYFTQAYVSCNAACTFNLERDGTAATVTTSTGIKAWNSASPSATTVAFTSSNVGVGTILGTYSLQAGGWIPIDITGASFQSSQTGKNLTIRTTSMTGTVAVIVKFYESN